MKLCKVPRSEVTVILRAFQKGDTPLPDRQITMHFTSTRPQRQDWENVFTNFNFSLAEQQQQSLEKKIIKPWLKLQTFTGHKCVTTKVKFEIQ